MTAHSSSDSPAEGPSDPTPAALRRLTAVVLTFGALVASTYLVPPSLERLERTDGVPGEIAGALGTVASAFARFQPWIPGEPVPFSAIADRWGGSIPAFAGAGSGYTAPQRVDEERASKRLGDAVAANLAETTGQKRGGPKAPAQAGAAKGKRAAGDGPDEDAPAVKVDPDEYDDIEVGIEDPGGRGMRPFYEALAEAARGKEGTLARVAHYGDSSIAADMITRTVRRRLQKRFGDGGHGFVLVARGNMHYGHEDVRHYANDAWTLRHIVRKQLGSEGHYGYGGVQYQGVPGARAVFGADPEGEVGQQVSRFRIFYQKGPRGGSLQLEVDDGEPQVLDTRADETEEAYHTIEVSEGEHELEIRARRGRPVLFGVALERTGPGVVYDSLGLVGARASRLLNFDAEHIRRQIAQRRADLLVLGFGGNEASAPVHLLQDYEQEFARVIERMRGGRENLACLVFAPLDQAHKNERGRIVTIPSVPHIVEAQRAAAKEQGCAFYNTFEAMGGKGAMLHWYRSRPRLSTGDFRHATPAGYRVIGTMFYKALLKGFAEYLD